MKLGHILLWPLGRLFQYITDLRNYAYDKKILKSVRFDLPVISVGNLSVGGTGKSPHVEYLIGLLQSQFRVATLSRGYGRKSHGFLLTDGTLQADTIGDEPFLFKMKYPDTTVAVAEDRVIAVPRILYEHPEVQVILLDDAFQHRAIRPGLSILLTEHDKLFTRDAHLPVGWLRETAKNYHRADLIVITKCPNDLSQLARAEILAEIKPYRYQRVFFSTLQYAPCYPVFRELNRQPHAANSSVVLVTGIADRSKLLAEVKRKHSTVVDLHYRDHHRYDVYDLENIRAAYNALPDVEKIILTTEKDAARLWLHRAWFLQNKLQLWVQPVAVKFLGEDESAFGQSVLAYVRTSLYKQDKSITH